MAPDPTSDRHHLILFGASLCGALLIGVLLRLSLAGLSLPFGRFEHLRSAHTHLGYYGVLFPLAWYGWSRVGLPTPGRRLTGAYALAVTAATVGFATSGYAPLSIAASTAVLLVWFYSSVPTWQRVLRRDWLAASGPAVLGSAVAIPAVAVLASRSDPRAGQLVQTFLSWLLFGVLLPSVLARGRAPAPPGPLLVVLVLTAGLALGPSPTLVPRLGLGGLAALLCATAHRLGGGVQVKLLWWGLGLGLAGVASGLLPHHPLVAVAGLHLAVLGPAMMPLLARRSLTVQRTYALAVAAFAGTILAPVLSPVALWWTLSAALGVMLAVFWLAHAALHPPRLHLYT